jgi:hypothetical protein
LRARAQGLAAITALAPLLAALHAPGADNLLRTQALLAGARVAASVTGDATASPFTAAALDSACHILVREERGQLTLGDAKSSLGDAKSSLGDAKSSLGDAESSLGDATSSLGDATSSLGDAKSSLGDAKSSLGDA